MMHLLFVCRFVEMFFLAYYFSVCVVCGVAVFNCYVTVMYDMLCMQGVKSEKSNFTLNSSIQLF
jgi:hypothetical protein